MEMENTREHEGVKRLRVYTRKDAEMLFFKHYISGYNPSANPESNSQRPKEIAIDAIYEALTMNSAALTRRI